MIRSLIANLLAVRRSNIKTLILSCDATKEVNVVHLDNVAAVLNSVSDAHELCSSQSDRHTSSLVVSCLFLAEN